MGISLIDAIVGRRSVRAFKESQITDEELSLLLKAGEYAPSGGGAQSPIIIAVQNKDLIAKLSKMNAAVMGKEGIDPYYGAPTLILVLADKAKPTPVEDGSLALGSMHLEAHDLGLGACWIHREEQMFETQEGKALLKEWGFEGDYIGVGALIVGYPEKELPEPPPRVPQRTKVIK
ncbi:MAG: nitroreductase family protein [Eubacteriaceae bacterium]|nr:nitroreductase family protein [Eubacteriaceae bacterium]